MTGQIFLYLLENYVFDLLVVFIGIVVLMIFFYNFLRDSFRYL